MAATKDQVRDYARTRWQTMETAAVNWRRMVRNAAMFVAPSDSQIMRWATPNERIIDGNLYDVTAIQANNVLAAGPLASGTSVGANVTGASGFTTTTLSDLKVALAAGTYWLGLQNNTMGSSISSYVA